MMIRVETKKGLPKLVSLFVSLFSSVSSPFKDGQAQHECYDDQSDKDKEDKFCNRSSSFRDPCESENRGNDGDNEEDECPFEHGRIYLVIPYLMG
jgi:hypothetical protein